MNNIPRTPCEIPALYGVEKIVSKDKLKYLFDLARVMFDNRDIKTIELDNIYMMYEKGYELWHRILGKTVEFFENGHTDKIRLFSGELDRVNSRFGKHVLHNGQLIVNSTVKTSSEIRATLLNEFVQFVNSVSDISPTHIKDGGFVRLAFGEGKSLIDAAEVFHKEMRGFIDVAVKYIAGPVMFRKNSLERIRFSLIGDVNDFIYETAKYRARKKDFALYVNRLITLIPLFAGYFHFYVIGEVILAEKPHGVWSDADNPKANAWFMIADNKLANDMRDFFDEYQELFTKEANLDKFFKLIKSGEKTDASVIDGMLAFLPSGEFEGEFQFNEDFFIRLELNCGRAVDLLEQCSA